MYKLPNTILIKSSPGSFKKYNNYKSGLQVNLSLVLLVFNDFQGFLNSSKDVRMYFTCII